VAKAMSDDRFYCDKLSATMQVQTCKQRHLSGNFWVCKGCAIGAGHAGIKTRGGAGGFVAYLLALPNPSAADNQQ